MELGITKCLGEGITSNGSLRQEALRLKEKKLADEVLAVSLGPKACQVCLSGIHLTFNVHMRFIKRPASKALQLTDCRSFVTM